MADTSALRAPALIEVTEFDPDMIEATVRLRPVSEAAVESLIASITELGIIKDEIIVRRVRKRGKGGGFRWVLIAGAHRLEACRRMGRKVPAKVYDCTDDWARMMEVDDNLSGAELTALDTAVFLAERKRIYERIYPETKRGIAGAVARWDAADTMSVASFAAATADKLGLSERHVFRLIALGEALEPGDIDRLRTAERPVKMVDLQTISKIGEAEERRSVVAALAEGRETSATRARKAWAAEKRGHPLPPKDPVDEAFLKLQEAFRRAPKRARRRFVEREAEALRQMLEDLDQVADGGAAE